MNEKERMARSDHDLPPQDQIGLIIQEVGQLGANDAEIPRLKELEALVIGENRSAEEVAVALKEAWEIWERKMARAYH
jgi:hypothetical protein